MTRIVFALFFWMGLSILPAIASPGADLFPVSSPLDLDHLSAAGPVCLWLADDWALVVPGSNLDAFPAIEPSVGGVLYLAFLNDDSSDARLHRMGAVPVHPGVWLIDCPPEALTGLENDLQLIRLGEPYTFKTHRSSASGFLPVSRDEQVQMMADRVDESSLMADLGTLVGFQTRYSYTSGCRAAGDWLANEFTALGCQVTRQQHTNGMAKNVIADQPGVTNPDEIIIICGHFDSTSLQPDTLAPGADDNGTGTAAVLQAARALSNFHFEKTIRYICFSGEEQGLFGSQAYAAMADTENQNIIAVYNFDMIGYVDQAPENLECVGNNASVAIVDHFIESAQTYTDLLVNRRIDGSIQQSDHAPFWSRGFPAFLGIEDSPLHYPDYHKITDTIDNVTPGFFADVTRAGAAAVASLALPMPRELYLYAATFDDASGDSDGWLDPNETLGLSVSLKNNLTTTSTPVQLTLECTAGQQYVSISDSMEWIPALLPGESRVTDSAAFHFAIVGNVPEFTPIAFRITLTSESPHADWYDFEGIASSYYYEESVHAFRFDSDPAWEITGGLWAFGIPQGEGGDQNGNPDPVSGYTGAHVIGTALNGDYPSNASATITSQPLDCSDMIDTELRLFKWLNIEQPRYDEASIWVGNAQGFVLVWQNPRELTDFTWDELVLDISDVADGQTSVQLRFGLSSDGGDEYSGWNIDDIRIGGLVRGDSIPTPTPGTPTPGTPTPHPGTPTPHPGTPTPTVPPDSIGAAIHLNNPMFRSGDPFLLTVSRWNTTAMPRELPLFIILDIEGSYWFWPDWSISVNWLVVDLPVAPSAFSETILDFTWPDQAGAAGGLKFWAAFTNETGDAIVGSYDVVEWGFE